MRQHIIDLSRSQLEAHLEDIGQPRYRADQIYKGLYVKNWESFADFSTLPKNLRNELARQFYLRSFKLIDEITSPLDHTSKYLWELRDGRRIESVTIYEGKRVTFCISSQVGCPLDCKFCATGKMGLLRDLSVAEIVEQVLQMKARAERPPTNIVFMGMGEPLLNYETVMRAADILSDPEGLCFNRKKITVSTSGIAGNIRRMADEAVPYSLAVSLNAVSQPLREKIMPIARKYPLDELLDAARYYTQKTRRRITFEYVLMKDLNDSEEDANQLVRLTRGIPCKINVIPCNSDDPFYRPPDDETVRRFDQIINKKNRTITIRNRKGWDIRAACGQLYADNENKKRKRVQTKTINL